MSAFDAGTCAAKRRRERRLRSWWRHERARYWPRCPTTRTQRWTPRTTPQGARRQSPAPGWDLASTMNFPRTMAGPPGVSGQRHCWSPGRRGRCSDTQASSTNSPRTSMFLLLQMVEQLPNCRAVLCHVSTGVCRAGYRSAEGLASRCSFATLVSRHAAGGTAGGSADDYLLLFDIAADYGAAR